MSTTFWKISFQFMLLSAALIAGDWLFDSVSIQSNIYALIAAGVIMILNRFVKPLLIVLTIPATIFTFGFFLLFINAILLMITAYLIPEFKIGGFWSAFWLSIFLSLVQLFFGQNRPIKVKVQKENDFDDYEEVQ
jgi:putative membrane protein